MEPVRLRSLEGLTLELHGDGYEFADERSDSRNWLNVRMVLSNGQDTWSAVSPCMLVFEVDQLAAWLEALGLGQRPKALQFMEPNLAVHLHRESHEMRFVIR